jgi:hypothetical protein
MAMSNAEEAKGKLHHVPGRCHHMAIGKAKSSQRQTVGPKPIEEDVESVVLRIPRIPHPGTGGPKVAGGADDSVWSVPLTESGWTALPRCTLIALCGGRIAAEVSTED